MSMQIERAIHQVIDALGYWGIALLMVLECVFPPIPSEVIVPMAGFVTIDGDYSFLGVCIAATAGSVIGAIMLYYVGKLMGGERLIALADRYGKWLGISGNDIQRSIRWFDGYGAPVVFFCRLIPGVRSLISIPAGMAGMPLLSFLTYTTAGSALWVVVLAYLGRLLGQHYTVVGEYMGPVGKIVIIGAALVGLAWLVWRSMQRRSALVQD